MQYLTKKEVADLLRVSIRTISNYMVDGLIPVPKRLGRKVLWDEDELIWWISLNKGCAPKKVASPPVSRGRPRKIIVDT